MLSTVGVRSIPQEHVVEAGVRAFASGGFHEVSMKDIAELAGISKPTIYAKFEDKAALLDAALEREQALLLEHLFAAYSSSTGRPLSEQIPDDVHALFAYATARPHGFRLLFGEHASAQVIAARSEVLARLEVRIAELTLHFAASSTRQRRTVVVSERGASLLASLVVAASIKGALVMLDSEEAAVEGIAAATASFVLSAMRDVNLNDLIVG